MNQNKWAFLLRKGKFVPWHGKPIWQRQCRLFNSSKPAAAAGTGGDPHVLPTPSPCSKTTLLKREISKLVGVKDTLAPNRSSHWCSKRLEGKWKVVCVTRRGLTTHCISNPRPGPTDRSNPVLPSPPLRHCLPEPRFLCWIFGSTQMPSVFGWRKMYQRCKRTSLQDLFHCIWRLFRIRMWLVLTELIFRYECQSKGVGRKGHWNVIRS